MSEGMQHHSGGFVRVIDVPGLGCEGVLVDTSTETILLLDPSMPRDSRMDCMVQAMGEQEDRLAS